MALILELKGSLPQFGEGCWLAPNATLVGQVKMGNECTVWFNAVLRGDVNYIQMGDRCNIQDGAVIHCTYQKAATILGNNVSVGHNAIVHGCVVEDNVLIGMGAIVMDGVHIGQGSIIAAGAIVTQNTQIPPGTIYAGNPAKFLKNVSDEHTSLVNRTAANYVLYASWFSD